LQFELSNQVPEPATGPVPSAIDIHPEMGSATVVAPSPVAVVTPTAPARESKRKIPSTISNEASSKRRKRGRKIEDSIDKGLTLRFADIDAKGDTTLRAFYTRIKTDHAQSCDSCSCFKPKRGAPQVRNKGLYVRTLKAIMCKHNIDEYQPGITVFSS
jgi:hypothetical protein